MDPRTDSLSRSGSELFADYVGGVIATAGRLVDNLLLNAGALAGDVIRDSADVVLAACDGFLVDVDPWEVESDARDSKADVA